MNLLTRIIRALNKEEIRGFRLFTDRIQSDKYDKKLVDLFDLIRVGKYEEGDKAIVQKLYPTQNTNAYYRLKNRLIGDLERSLLLQHHNLDERVKCFRYITLGRLFLFKSEYSVSHEYYLKAAKTAQKADLLDLEVVVCEELQNLSNYYGEIDLPDVIQHKNKLLAKFVDNQRIDGLLQVISYSMKRSNFDGRNHQLLAELEEIQQSLELLPEQQDANVKLKINKCVREALLGKKDFITLEKYLITSYQKYLAEGLFNANTHKEKIVILSWIVNTLTKNSRFEESLAYTHELLKVLKEHKGLYHQQYIWTYYQGLVFNYSGSGQPLKAIELLKKVQSEMSPESIPAYNLFVIMNLARLYFDIQDYAQATTHLNQLLHRETFQSLDPPLRLTVSLAELILRLEMRDWDYANHRLREFKRKFRSQLQTEAFATEAKMLEILRLIGRNMSFLPDKKLNKMMDDFVEQTEYEVGSNEFISYKAWVYAKRHQRDYYELILDWIDDAAS